jgi:ATP-dependent exoDNAse (exonuclease V) alpha subunit
MNAVEKITSETMLSASQTNALNKLTKFVESTDKKVAILKGSAGTGKTTLVRFLIDNINKNDFDVALCAPTGKSAEVLGDKTHLNTSTVHKKIYERPEAIDSDYLEFFAQLEINDADKPTVYLIDESSLLSDKSINNNSLRFGSGRLLEDLIEYVGVLDRKFRHKIIFIGDQFQLAPIGMNYSPAICSDYLKNVYCIEAVDIELTEVQRHGKESGILETATKLRNSLTDNNISKLDFNDKYSDVVKIKNEKVIQSYVKLEENNFGDSMIIAHTNKKVASYNRKVRDYLYPNNDGIQVGEKLIVMVNKYYNDVQYLNGEFIYVKKVKEESIIRKLNIKNKENEKTEVILKFKILYVANAIDDKEDNWSEVIVYENLLESDENNISLLEKKALFVDFKIRNPSLSAGTFEFDRALATDHLYNALPVKYGYAITCHKAQGSEWENVYVDLEISMNPRSEDYYRWIYTAITRAKKQLYLVELELYEL